MDRWKIEQGRAKKKIKKDKIREKKQLEKKRYRCMKRKENRKTLFFLIMCGSGGSKSRLTKAAGAELAG